MLIAPRVYAARDARRYMFFIFFSLGQYNVLDPLFKQLLRAVHGET